MHRSVRFTFRLRFSIVWVHLCLRINVWVLQVSAQSEQYSESKSVAPGKYRGYNRAGLHVIVSHVHVCVSPVRSSDDGRGRLNVTVGGTVTRKRKALSCNTTWHVCNPSVSALVLSPHDDTLFQQNAQNGTLFFDPSFIHCFFFFFISSRLVIRALYWLYINISGSWSVTV